MISLPPKMLLTTPDGQQFIWFRNTKLSLWIEVSNFQTKSEAMKYIFQATTEFNARNMRLRYSDFSFGKSAWCVLIVLEVENLSGMSVEQYNKTLENRLDRLASWYKFTYLIPGEKPITNT